MKIEIHTDRNIAGDQLLRQDVATEVESALSRFGDWITRVEVHLSDANSSAKSGANDKQCVIEARPASRQPVKVSHDSDSIEQAYKGAVKKLQRLLGDTYDKLHQKKGGTSMSGD
ncbi:MAG TPA: HPF/RaiA family ribosome-associated protein [Gemmatales bacterium]|nr:HPF/RaiA family ribosome-associated protein [Gemmatales bacterium]